MKTYHMKVIGRVQGVGFRYYTLERANSLGISGWVRNLEDGSVEISATGNDATLTEFVECVKKGPAFSRVAEVFVNEAPTGSGKDNKAFRIV